MADWVVGWCWNFNQVCVFLISGCGRAMSSIFFAQGIRRAGLGYWLMVSVNENLQRIKRWGGVRCIPDIRGCQGTSFAAEFFDVIISIDSFIYYGTDDLYLNYLARLVKPGGQIAIAGAGILHEFDIVPDHLKAWWTNDLWCLHSADWWKRHWARTGIVDISIADVPDGWRLWKVCIKRLLLIIILKLKPWDWPGSLPWICAVVGTRKHDVLLEEPIISTYHINTRNNQCFEPRKVWDKQLSCMKARCQVWVKIFRKFLNPFWKNCGI